MQKKKLEYKMIEKGDKMIERKKIIETGWNLDNSYARLPKSFFTILNPTPVHSPKLVILNSTWLHP